MHSGATAEDGTNFSLHINPDLYSGGGANEKYPLPLGAKPGDSGSPTFIYNSATGQYEYIAAVQSAGIASNNTYSQARGNVEWTALAMEQFNERVQMSGTDTVYLNAINTAGETISDTVGDTYRFGGSGHLTLDTELSGAIPMEIDGQGNEGSSVTFARENAYTGDIVAGGGLKLDTPNSTGSVGIHAGNANALAAVNSLQLKQGATLYTDGHAHMTVQNLSAESGAAITNNGALVLTVGADNNRLLWSADSTTHEWNTTAANWSANGSSTNFTAGTNVVLSASGTEADNSSTARETISLNTEDISAGTVSVIDASYEITGSRKLAGTTLQVADKSDLKLSTDAEFASISE